MFLLVGLGNPGAKYAKNRHNIGFMAVDEIARQYNFGAERSRLQGLAREGVIETETGSQKIILVKPQTFMNESGRCVGGFMTFHKIPLPKVFVYYDEVELTPGRCRVKVGGGTAGHNGLRSIVAQSGPGFKRVRLGVGHPGREKMLSHVLDDFSSAEMGWVDTLCDRGRSNNTAALGRQARRLSDQSFHTRPAPARTGLVARGQQRGLNCHLF
jgi:peptidyl-tRNA hydrolase, PTH1 family